MGAIGDGVHDDTSALSELLSVATGGEKIDGRGLTFKVSTLPDVSRFKNARFYLREYRVSLFFMLLKILSRRVI